MWEAYLYTFLWSMSPILELRFSVPFAIWKLHLHPLEAILVSTFGSLCIAVTILTLLPTAMKILTRMPVIEKTVHKIFEKTRKDHSHRIALVGEVALVALVAIPLPGSGAFTGSLVAYLFGLHRGKAIPLIGLGSFLSGWIIVGIMMFGRGIAHLFFLP